MKLKLVIAGSAMLLALSALAQNNGTNNTKDKACCSACTVKCGCSKNCCTNGKCDKSKCSHEACSAKDSKSSK